MAHRDPLACRGDRLRAAQSKGLDGHDELSLLGRPDQLSWHAHGRGLSGIDGILRSDLIAERVRHCEPTGPRQARPDDRLHEAIQKEILDCFVALLLAMTLPVTSSAGSRFLSRRRTPCRRAPRQAACNSPTA